MFSRSKGISSKIPHPSRLHWLPSLVTEPPTLVTTKRCLNRSARLRSHELQAPTAMEWAMEEVTGVFCWGEVYKEMRKMNDMVLTLRVRYDE